MKTTMLVIIVSLLVRIVHGQESNGKVLQDSITSAALKNSAGESTTRRVWVYLPPDYDQGTERYPTIYYLHGYGSPPVLNTNYTRILGLAIETRRIRPVLFVVCDQYTSYGGSFYANSTLTGNWADFTAKDLIAFVIEPIRNL